LQKDLLTLINPYPDVSPPLLEPSNQCAPDPGFTIELVAPEFPGYEGPLSERFLSASWAILRGEVDDNGRASYTLEIRKPRKHLSYSPSDEIFPGLLKAKFKIHYFVYRSPLFRDFDFGVREASRIGREHGGVRIYLDNFRVFPYGDPKDDWLRLDEMRAGRLDRPIFYTNTLTKLEHGLPGRPFLLIPGNNQVFGVVALSQTLHPDIKINVSRERLFENEAFERLRRFVLLGIYWMTLQYARFKARGDIVPDRPGKVPGSTSASLIEAAREQLQEVEDLPRDVRQKIEETLNEAIESAEEEREAHISDLSMLRIMASAGTSVHLLNHQLRAVVDGIRGVYTDLYELRPHLGKEAQNKLDRAVAQIKEWHEFVSRQAEMLGFLMGREARSRLRQLNLFQVVDNVARPLGLYMQDHGIEFLNRVPRTLRTPPIYEAELYAVLLNLLTNALKAVRGLPERRIAVEAEWVERKLVIRMLDTGKGLEPEKWEEVFEPFVTTSAPDPILGVGTGLGLTVARDLVAQYEGSTRFIEPRSPWRTCVEVILPESQ